MSNENIKQNVAERIAKWKKLLLDMTKRNRLLWYKPLKIGSLKLEPGCFDDEIENVLAEIDKLAFCDKSIRFIAEPEISTPMKQQGSLLPTDEQDDIAGSTESQDDQQKMIIKRTRSLSNILRKVKLEAEEEGLNIGYIAVGFLEWHERDDSESVVKSPLIMIPIKVEQEGRLTPFKVSLNADEQIVLNPVVLKKLETDFNITIEDLPAEFKEGTTLVELLEDIRRAISGQPNWRITDEAVLDTFSFQNLAIWSDLDKNADLIANNPFSKVLAGAERIDEGFAYEEGDPDLEKTAARDNLNIYKTDSSQQEAIYRAKNGESFVIQGPPGTGKSQTITNIIAELLYLNKKVLFVSEKRAALDVVYHKLEKKDLSDFCLILHNSKQRKASIREQIEKSFEMSQRGRSVSGQSMQIYDNYDSERKKLNLYNQSLHENIDGEGVTPYRILGELDQLHGVADLAFKLPKTLVGGADCYAEMSDTLIKVRHYGESFIDNTHHFDDNYWQYYTGKFDNTTRREVQEMIGAITEDLLQQKSNAITPSNLPAAANEYFELLQNIPFTQARCDGVSQLVKSLEDKDAKENELKNDNVKLATWCENIRREILLAFPESFLSFNKAKEYYETLINKRSTFFGCLSSEYRDTIKKLNSFTTQKLKHSELTRYLKLLVELNENTNKIEINKNQMASIEKTIPASFRDLKVALTEQNKSLVNLLSHLDYDKLTEYESYINAKKILLSKPLELEDFVAVIEDKNKSFRANEIGDIFRKRFLTLYLETTNFDKQFADYTSQDHNRDVDLFREYDKETLRISAERIRCELASRLPNPSSFTNAAHGGEVQLLQRELKKKSRLMPTRRLIERLPVLLPQLKPCMMMSPLTVSSYLGANPNWKFDTVIFDEASQVRPEYAIASIVRGSQVIVAGDSKQMPPTSFFDIADYDDESYDDENPQTDNLESILDEMSSAFPNVYLNWHYRSKDESLIAFSNHHFYNDRLVTFPSPNSSNEKTGVNFVYCDNGLWENKSGNRAEAEKVALLVFDHINIRPKQSLGVIAFGKSQENAIEEAVNKLRDLHPENEEFFSDLKAEPFFIKNLENVQGDERDRIILSCGYGKDRTGNFAMRFGPLAAPGGERRLNVAISRSKVSMTVVSSFRANEIRAAENNPGRKLIRDFIDYAERGKIALLGENGPNENIQLEFDSGFEEDVYNYLINQGYKLRTQVGASGYRIDMAVFHPDIVGRYILAIECDGAPYHSSRTARDRDILRQQILEGLGWRFHRIWSTDWFHSNQHEKQRLILAINQAIEKYNSGGYAMMANSNNDNDKQESLYLNGTEEVRDNVDEKLSQIYLSWQKTLKKQFGEGTVSSRTHWSNNDGWNSLYVMEHYDAIEKIIDQVLKYKNGFSEEDLFREINERVFNKNRYTAQARRIYESKFKRNFLDQNKVEIINGSIKTK